MKRAAAKDNKTQRDFGILRKKTGCLELMTTSV
jgi:hypothetical protein